MKAKAKKVIKPKVVKTVEQPRFWILWGPASGKPPRIRFSTEAEADRVAKIMVGKYHQQFYVMESKRMFQDGPPTEVSLRGKPAKKTLREQHPDLFTWKTYKEWRETGYQVRSGEKCTFMDRSGMQVPMFNNRQVDSREKKDWWDDRDIGDQ